MNENCEIIRDEFLHEEYEVIHHESGLTVYLFPKDLSTSYAALSVRYGSLQRCFLMPETGELHKSPEGIAHFLEHKMFENEDGVDTFDLFSAMGASANAYTSNEGTSYLFSTTGDLKEPLKLLLSYVRKPYFTQENVTKEQGIIGQEIKMYDDNPFNRLYYAVMESLYHKHPVRENICGSVETIATITPEELNLCHSLFYTPANMLLAISGRFERDEVLALVNEAFSGMKRTPIPEIYFPEEPHKIARKEFSFSMDVSRPFLSFGIKDTDLPADPKEREKRAIAMNIISDLYFGTSSEFYEALYEEGVVSKNFGCYYEADSLFGHLILYASVDDPSLLKTRIRTYFDEIRKTPPAREDVERIRRVHYAEYVKEFDNTEEIGSALLEADLSGCKLFYDGAILSEISYEYICSVINTFFEEKKMVEVVLAPLPKRG